MADCVEYTEHGNTIKMKTGNATDLTNRAPKKAC